MKTKIKMTEVIVMTLLLVMIATSVFSQKPNRQERPQGINQEQAPPPPPPPPPPPAPNSPPPPSLQDRMEAIVAPPLNLPDLTNEQQDKIHLADLEHMKSMTPLQNQLHEKKARLQTILTTSPFDAKSADQVAEEMGKVETGILKETIRHDQALRNLLTSQQQIVFDSRPKPFLRPGRK